MTCNKECELWIQRVEDLEGSVATQSESKMLIKLDDKEDLQRLEWDRYTYIVLK